MCRLIGKQQQQQQQHSNMLQVDCHYLDSNIQFFETKVWYCHSPLTARNTKP